jgi:hypothetical protein
VSDRKHPAGARAPRSAFLRVRGPVEVTFRVDPAGPERAMIQGPHASLTHLERELPEPTKAAIPSLRDAVSRASSHADAALRVEEALVRAGSSVDRRDEPRVPVRRHPGARLERDDLLLVDHELLGLRHGLRTVAKRMCPPGAGAERVSRLGALGFVATRFGVTTHGASQSERDVVLVARETSALEHAREIERALVRAAAQRDDDAAIVREMGALLGYPRCCVERFVRLRARDDASLAGALLGPHGARTPFETAFTVPPFTLVSHAPCSPTCAATRSLVRSLVSHMPVAARASYVRLAEACWGIDDDGMLIRTDAAGTTAIDVSDPGLESRSVAPPAEGALHWVIETQWLSDLGGD